MPKKEPVKYWKARHVAEIAEELIPQYHQHLEESEILYLFRSEHTEENGKVKLGKARKVSGLNAYLARQSYIEGANLAQNTENYLGDKRIGLDDPGSKVFAEPLLIVEIAHDVWSGLTVEQRVALVDHELSHFGPDGMRSHDVEEFRDVIERHGLWTPDLEAVAETIAQQELFPVAGVKGPTFEDQVNSLKKAGVTSITVETEN